MSIDAFWTSSSDSGTCCSLVKSVSEVAHTLHACISSNMAYCKPLAAVNACPVSCSRSRAFSRVQTPKLQCKPRRLDAFTTSQCRAARVCSSRRQHTTCSAASAQADSRSGKIRLIQHKEEAFWFYRFLSIVYDTVVNPGHWTEDMRTDALLVAELNDQNLKVNLHHWVKDCSRAGQVS